MKIIYATSSLIHNILYIIICAFFSPSTVTLKVMGREGQQLKLRNPESLSCHLKENHSLLLSDSGQSVMFVRNKPLLC